ncbi:Uncharacterised protein [Legionella beliardensis]|uniref:Uncharacterized protein n=1 Tax=Legionella beliardensis TaxID=91822 RepID=A0A378I0S6_9GAMM|nr:hypothetical protein [Legionella beliardensis]STX28196.1 Uncharacterised protein [Legionella beliardensis]
MPGTSAGAKKAAKTRKENNAHPQKAAKGMHSKAEKARGESKQAKSR